MFSLYNLLEKISCTSPQYTQLHRLIQKKNIYIYIYAWILTRESNRLIAISWLQMHSHGSLIFINLRVQQHCESWGIWNLKQKVLWSLSTYHTYISTNNVSPSRSNYDQLAHNLPQIKLNIKSSFSAFNTITSLVNFSLRVQTTSSFT